jgi:hypothetical protein
VKEQPFSTYEGRLIFYPIYIYLHRDKENYEGSVGQQLQEVPKKFFTTTTT